MAAERLLDVIKRELRERGYKEVEPNPDGGGVWASPDGSIDHLFPMVEDCLEREDVPS